MHSIEDSAGEELRVLRVGGAYQSATYLGDRWAELPFEYYRAFDHMFDAVGQNGFAVHDVLMIGGGGCSYPKHLLMTHVGVRLDVLENDSRIARIARKHFFVDRLERELAQRGEGDRFRLIVADGVEYLRECESHYDVCINDAFVGGEPVRVLLRPEALRDARRVLAPGGLYMVNVVVGDTLADAEFLGSTLGVLEEAFGYVAVVPATDPALSDDDNYVVIASEVAYAFEGVQVLGE